MMDCARRWTAASLMGVGRYSNGQSCLRVCRWTKASGYSTGVHYESIWIYPVCCDYVWTGMHAAFYSGICIQIAG